MTDDKKNEVPNGGPLAGLKPFLPVLLIVTLATVFSVLTTPGWVENIYEEEVKWLYKDFAKGSQTSCIETGGIVTAVAASGRGNLAYVCTLANGIVRPISKFATEDELLEAIAARKAHYGLDEG